MIGTSGKRFQVFISSTFVDLKDARKEVSEALLKANCFPAGMELFPAADMEQFEYIKEIISESDYYVVISAGKYGTLHPSTGVSFTEMEYDFAVSIGIPIIRLLHKDPFNSLRGEHIESKPALRKKLQNFRDKLSTERLVSFWSSSAELGTNTVLGLIDAQKRKPAIGWIRADNAENRADRLELDKLRAENDELKKGFSQEAAINVDSEFSSLSPILCRIYERTEKAIHQFENQNIFGKGSPREASLNDAVFSITDKFSCISAQFYAERLIAAFLHEDEFPSADKLAGAIANDNKLQMLASVVDMCDAIPIVKTLEQLGILSTGEKRNFRNPYYFQDENVEANYLNANHWNLTEKGRKLALHLSKPGTFIQSSDWQNISFKTKESKEAQRIAKAESEANANREISNEIPF